MAIDFLYPQYEVVRNPARCIACRACERQCSNEVHAYDDELKMMISDESRCVNCHRCVSICPTRALKIVKTDHTFKENANWSGETIMEVYRQASSGGVLLSSMGNPKPLPVYWDKILINASQVTNPCIRITSAPAPPSRSKWGRAQSRASAAICRVQKLSATFPARV